MAPSPKGIEAHGPSDRKNPATSAKYIGKTVQYKDNRTQRIEPGMYGQVPRSSYLPGAIAQG